MNTESLSATTRAASGKGGARKLRQGGNLPAVVYRGGGEALSIAIDPTQFDAIFRRTRDPNTLIRLELKGDERVCLVKAVQRHPVTKMAKHVDFYQVDPDATVEIKVPLRSTGIAAGTKLGGSLRIIHRFLDIVCKPADIPAAIYFDVTDLEVDDIVKISQIDTPKGCTLDFETDFNVMSVIGKRLEEEEEEVAEEGEEGEEGEEDSEEDES